MGEAVWKGRRNGLFLFSFDFHGLFLCGLGLGCAMGKGRRNGFLGEAIWVVGGAFCVFDENGGNCGIGMGKGLIFF